MLAPILQKPNKKLKNIARDPQKLHSLSKEEFNEIIELSIKHDDYSVLDKLAELHTGIYSFDANAPSWLKTDFSSNVWLIEVNDTPIKINWSSVKLNDGSYLSDSKHRKLLNSFKYWIVAAENPFENGGQILTGITVYQKINRIINLINAILLRAETVDLAANHLLFVNDDFWLDLLKACAEKGIQRAIYEPDERIREITSHYSHNVSKEKIAAFVKKYPYLNRKVEEEVLGFSLKERAVACFYLHERGIYQKSGTFHAIGNMKALTLMLYESRALTDGLTINSFPELYLSEKERKTEFPAQDNRDKSASSTDHTISTMIDSIKLINTNFERPDAAQPPELSSRLNVKTVSNIVNVKTVGRTRTQSPEFVFNLIRQAFELSFQYLAREGTNTSLLDELLNVMKAVQSLSKIKKRIPKSGTVKGKRSISERDQWLENDATKNIQAKKLYRNIKQIRQLTKASHNQFDKLRKKESLISHYYVILGAIQILVGALLARRQDELIKLKPFGNLVPNESPYLASNKNKAYSLKIKLKKTGVGDTKKEVARPIPLSLAKLVWELEQFNCKAKELGLLRGKGSLFNGFKESTFTLKNSDSKRYNDNLDIFSDFIETDLAMSNDGTLKRNYVRQHQLRRFNAMVFFWSKGFDGMDALRWMLGHSDIEHLYRYISENEPGTVLNSSKAAVITRGLFNSDSEVAQLEGIEKVREVIAERLAGNKDTPITLELLSEAAGEYDNDMYYTVPSIDSISAEQEVESEVLRLFEESYITLEPEFFTVLNSQNVPVKTFNLILKINEREEP